MRAEDSRIDSVNIAPQPMRVVPPSIIYAVIPNYAAESVRAFFNSDHARRYLEGQLHNDGTIRVYGPTVVR